MGMLIERFTENEKKVMVLKPHDLSLETAIHQSVFFAKKHACDEYRLALPKKTVVFEQGTTEEALQKQYKKLTPEEYHRLEHEVSPFAKDEWVEEDKKELYAFLFDLALLLKNIPWAIELYTIGTESKEMEIR